MYRAVAWALRKHDLRRHEANLTLEMLEQLPLRFDLLDGELVISFRGTRLGDELREPEITNMASRVSQLAAFELSHGLATTACDSGDVVAEGRDMTTVVFPDTPFKVFLTADIGTRAGVASWNTETKGLRSNTVCWRLRFERAMSPTNNGVWLLAAGR